MARTRTRKITHSFAQHVRPHAQRRPRRGYRPRLESLEDRTAPALYNSALPLSLALGGAALGNGSSDAGPRMLSDSGRYGVFASTASNLVAGVTDTNGTTDVFLRDFQTGTLSLVSVNSAGTGTGSSTSDSPTISADGRYVAFRSAANNLAAPDSNFSYDIFVRDLLLNTTTLVSVNSAGANGGNSTSQNPTISGDGALVAWESYSTDLVSGFSDTNGTADIFVRNWRGATPMTTLVSRDGAGTGTGNAVSYSALLSADGSTLAFLSNASNLLSGVTDNNNTTDAFAYAVGTGMLSLLSAEPTTPGTGNNVSSTAARTVSADGRYEVFVSTATNLVAGISDVNNTSDVFVRDLQLGTTTLASVNSAGTGTSNGASDNATISANGRYVAFRSYATNLPGGSTNGNYQIYVRDLSLNTTTLISRNSAGTNGGNSTSQNPTLSGDGALIAWESYSTDLVGGFTDSNGERDIFVRNWQDASPMTTLVSRNSAGTATANAVSFSPLFSVDGSTVAFLSNASNLIGGATDNNNTTDVYVYDVAAATVNLISAEPTAAGTGNNQSTTTVRTTSADGRYQVFSSIANNLVAGVLDVNATWDVFVRDLQLGTTTLVSINAAGTGAGNGGSDNATISANGRYVAFRSYATDLPGGSTNGNYQVYVRDLTLNTTTLISVNSSGTDGGNNTSQNPTISGDGQLVAFESYASNLVAGFTDSNFDRDIFMRNWQSATPMTTLISRNSAGTGTGNSNSFNPVLSVDGSTVAFLSNASDLLSSVTDNNGTTDAFAYAVSTSALSLLSAEPTTAGTGNAASSTGARTTSADGRYEVFVSAATNLVAGMGDVNGSNDVFVRDLMAGTTTLVSVTSAGTSAGNSFSDSATISADGRYVAFRSGATDLPGGSTNGYYQIYVRDLTLNTTTLISRNSAGTNGGNNYAYSPTISGDGKFVAYESYADNLVSGVTDSNGTLDVFMRNWQAAMPVTTLVSRNSAGTGAGNSTSYGAQLSVDGSTVAFLSYASDLVAGLSDTNSTIDVFTFDTATLARACMSVTSAGTAAGNSSSDSVALSDNGQIVAFRSFASNLVANDLNGTSDVLVRDRGTSSTSLISINSAGMAGGNSTSDSPAISSDGRYVAFRSFASNLAAPDTNFNADIFVRDRQTSTTTLISPNSGGTDGGNNTSQSPTISGDGQFVAYESYATNLVSGFTDTNSERDVFLRNWQATTPVTTLVSHNSAGMGTGNAVSFSPVFGASASTLIFNSNARNLITGLSDLNGAQTDVFAFATSTGMTSVVSAKAAGVFAGNSTSDSLAMSDNGQIVAFRSFAIDLHSNDTNSYTDVFVRDRTTDTTALVSLNSAGTASGNYYSDSPTISSDGRYVAFRSGAADLAAGDTNSNADIFVRDLLLNMTTLISPNSGGTDGGNSTSQNPTMSGDGLFVAYESYATNLVSGFTDSNNERDIFLRNWQASTPVTTLVSHNSAGTGTGNAVSYSAFFGASSGTLIFHSNATNLVSGFSDLNGTSTDVFAFATATSTTSLVSAKASGLFAGNSTSDSIALSDDGQIVVFRSSAYNLAASDTNGYTDVFMRDRSTNTTTMLSLNSAGTASGNYYSDSPALSSDGRYVAFRSGAADLAAGDTNFNADIFVRDRLLGVTTLISPNSAGTNGGNSTSQSPTISGDGMFVAYESYATDLVSGFTEGNAERDIFIRNWQAATPATTLVSHNTAGTGTGNAVSFSPYFGARGGTLIFHSNANNLLAGVNDLNGTQSDVFAFATGTGMTSLVSAKAPGLFAGNSTSDSLAMSDNGQIVAFRSFATDLAGNDTNGYQDVYVRNRTSNTTSIASINSAGTASGNYYSDSPSVSGDGRYIAFRSGAADLAAPDTNFNGDIFVRDLQSSMTTLISPNSAGTNGNNSTAQNPLISRDGNWVAFESVATDLVTGVTDSNGTYDVFVRNWQAAMPVTELLSRTGGSMTSGNSSSNVAGVSGIGTTVLFKSYSTNLVSGVTDSNGAQDVFASTEAIPPTVIGFNDPDADDLVPVNVTLTYTIVFDEDINEATLTAADLDNAGVALITIGAIVETSPGVFTVEVTPTTGGSLRLRIPAGATITDMVGNPLTTPMLDNDTLTVDAAAPTASFDDGDIDNLVPVNQTMLYTILFSEAIDGSTFTTADLDNAGTAAITLGTLSQLGPDSFTLEVTPTTAGTIVLEISGAIQDVAGNFMSVPVQDDTTVTVDAVPPMVNSIVDSDADNLIAINTLLTCTITFSEDMDGSSVTAADFDNAGTAMISFGIIIETSPGVFEVNLQATTPGTLRLRIPAGAIVKDVAGNDLVPPVLDDDTLTVRTEIVPPTVLSIDDGDADNLVPVNGTMLYTITFDEDIDASTFHLADLGTSGTATTMFANLMETTPGVFTAEVTPSTGGTIHVFIADTADIKDVAGNSLVVPVSDDTTVTVDAVLPTVLDIADDDPDNQVATNSTVTYTITFSEDMDATSVTAADFNNAGTATITFGTITETSPGVLAVQVRATSLGTIQLRIPAGAVIKDLAGNSLTPPVTDDDVLDVVLDDVPPTILNIDDGDADNLVPVNQAVLYTITFDEDINEATVTADDFANEGTATVSFGMIAEPSPGVFTVEVTPTTAGTILLTIPAGAVIEDLGGNDLVVPVQDDTTLNVDAVLPTVNSIDDGDADDLVPFNQMMTYTISFSEDMDASTLAAGDLNNAGTATLSFGAINETTPGLFTVEVTPTTGGTLILRIVGDVKDVAGNSLVVPVQDDTTVNVDAVPPMVDSFDDGDGDDLVPVNQTMTYTITFSEDIDANTLTVSDLNNTGSASITFGAINETTPGVFTVEVTPTTGGTIILRIIGEVRDIAGNSLAVPVQDDTSVTVDAFAPTVNSIDDGDTDDLVPVNQTMTYTISFSEDMDASTLTAADLDNAGTAGITFGAINEIMQGNFTVEVTPTTGGTIILRISGIVRDVAGNDLAVPVQDDTSVTVDAVPPMVNDIDDGDADDLVPVNQMMTYTITFSEDIDASTFSAANLENDGTATISVGTIDEPTPGVFTVEVTPTTGGTIILSISGIVRDVAGNVLAIPVQDDTTVTVDAVPPMVDSIDDGDADDLVPVNQPMTYTIAFSEDIDASTLSATDLNNAGTATISFGAINETTAGVFTVEVTPTTGGTFILGIVGDVRDVAGNSLAVPVQDDTSVTVDAVPPMVDSVDDGDADDLVPVNQLMIYTIAFSEDIDASTLTAAALNNAGTATITFGAINETMAGVFTVEVTPTSGGTIILRIVGDVRDVAGNSLAEPVQDDTTVSVDAVAPTVDSIDDGDADDLVPVNQTMTYTIAFSEDIDAGTLTSADLNNAGTATLTFGSISEPMMGVFMVEVTPTTGGTIILRIVGDVRDVAGNSLAVPVQDDTTVTVDAAPPMVTDIDDGDADNLVNINTLLVFTVTFSEDMDASSVTVGDFDNAGTSAITFGAIAEIMPGVFTVEVTPTTGGTLQLRIPAGAVVKDVAGNDLATPVSDDVSLTVVADADPPLVQDIDDGDPDNQVPVGQMLLYTITFNEDIDESTVDASDFDNAGTATIAIGAITETMPGVFTVEVTPSTTGTLILRIAGVITDLAGNPLAVPVLDDTTVTVGFTSISGKAFNDLDGDGVKDADEPGAPGITITLDRDADGSVEATTMTNANGHYTFSNLGPGTYRIRVGLTPGMVQTTPNPADIVVAGGVPVTGIDFGLGRETLLALGADRGSQPLVQVFDHNNMLRFSFLAYGAAFSGGVRVATGDVTGDGVPDIITVPGGGRRVQVRVFDGNPVTSGNLTPVLLTRFRAFPADMKNGAYVAVGDVNGDGTKDIIVAAGPGVLPEVRVFDGRTIFQSPPTLLTGAGFLAFAPTFQGGVTVAAGDIDGDGRAEIVTGVAKKSEPLINVWELTPAGNGFNLLESFQGLPASYTRGVSVAVGDFNGDGRRDIIVGNAKGAPPLVQVFATDPGNDVIFASMPLADVMANAYPPTHMAGTRVVAKARLDPVTAGLVGKADIWAGFGRGSTTRSIRRIAHNDPLSVTDAFFATAPEFEGGVFVG